MGIIIVTGGSRGIGAATCVKLAAAGHDVTVGYRGDADAAAQVVAKIEAAGRRAIAVRVDVSDGTQVRELFDRTQAALGTPTGLVNNAAVSSTMGPFTELSEADLRRVFDVNVIGAVLCAQEAARRMAPGGAIVNVSSVAANLGSPGEYVHYAASKAAVETLTVGLSKELGPAGIRVNTVSPGIIHTGFHAGSGEPGRADRLGPAAPLGRSGQPEEVANAIAWLLSDEASYTTGATLKVSGGR
ncbi:oxidoreductase [Catellatospora methionotrophica]|uniref:Oxidoreductase n=1 Tax=Catellatospora methionotrophica TaxID=121620 RepID=A0A8J3PJM0_9ACTN|nr:SDR family oxidoreductase [Catellatospora methionotrophica]GIG18949.1 oxidoreductase [Catellatospora methionotrophica]